MLTATQEDYLEAIHRIASLGDEVHVSLLATKLGCKLPTVTRTIQRMVELGYVDHQMRGTVRLTKAGRSTAEHLVHRHEDLVRFLGSILGLGPVDAEISARQLEHGMSALAAQRLHQWLEHVEALSQGERDLVYQFEGRQDEKVPDFDRLTDVKAAGWRG